MSERNVSKSPGWLEKKQCSCGSAGVTCPLEKHGVDRHCTADELRDAMRKQMHLEIIWRVQAENRYMVGDKALREIGDGWQNIFDMIDWKDQPPDPDRFVAVRTALHGMVMTLIDHIRTQAAKIEELKHARPS